MRRLPGLLAAGLALLITGIWTYWSVAEMYHEGWWGAWHNRVYYLIPGGVILLLSAVGLSWPRAGSVLIFLVVGVFAVFWFGEDLLDNRRIDTADLPVFLLLGGVIGSVGLLLWYEARRRRLRRRDGFALPRWWVRHFGTLLLLTLNAAIIVSVSAYYLPIVLTREDDGYRGARLIAGNEITLVWAPEGPGWNWKQDWGGYPSWSALALYGVEPVGLDSWSIKHPIANSDHMAKTGLCAYLSADGLTLAATPQYIWRMPTVDELVRSLARHGNNAGCTWDGSPGFTDCDRLPDKESPLWATDKAPIYYWAADVYNDEAAYFVAYNGAVNRTLKNGGNPRHSYRCVRDPQPENTALFSPPTPYTD